MVKRLESRGHAECIADAILAAELGCAAYSLRLTAARRRVIEFLLQEQVALGAYDILERLRRADFSAQPPVAYRALKFLVSNGFAHKVERLNAVIACAYPIVGAAAVSSGQIPRAPGLKIGYVPQRLHIDATLPITVERFMNMPLAARRSVREAALVEAGVPDLSKRQMSELSGGQFQRV